MRYAVAPELRRTALASSFGAVLEMTREGHIELSQSEAFGPLLVRRRDPVIERRGGRYVYERA